MGLISAPWDSTKCHPQGRLGSCSDLCCFYQSLTCMPIWGCRLPAVPCDVAVTKRDTIPSLPKNKRVFASLSKLFLAASSASCVHLGKFKEVGHLWQIPNYCPQVLLHQHPASHSFPPKPSFIQTLQYQTMLVDIPLRSAQFSCYLPLSPGQVVALIPLCDCSLQGLYPSRPWLIQQCTAEDAGLPCLYFHFVSGLPAKPQG